MKMKKILFALLLSILCVIITEGCVEKKADAERTRENLKISGTEYPEDGTWRYSLKSGEEELAYINVSTELIFNDDDGIAVDEYGNVYMLYYSSNPYQIQIYQVEMPGKVDSTTWFGIDRNGYEYGFAKVYINDELYIIKTNKEAMVKQFLNNINDYDYSKPLKEKPHYKVIKADKENFQAYTLGFSTEDKGVFFLSASLSSDGSYEYNQKFMLNEITKHYLGHIVQYNNVKKWFSKRYESYQEVETAIKELSDFLDDYEKKYREEIAIKFMHSDKLMNDYPDVAKKYGIFQNDLGELKIDKLELEKYLDAIEDGSEKYVYSKHQELIEEYPELAAKYGNVFVNYVKINVEEESLKKYLDMLSSKDRKEFFWENFQNILEVNPDLAVEYIEDIPDRPNSIPEKTDIKNFLNILEEKYPEKLGQFLRDKENWLRENYSDILF